MALEVKKLAKSYRGVSVLQGVDLAVPNGEIHALLGANGAGKSTLVRCIAGATSPDSGAILVEEQVHADWSPRAARRAGVAVIYQELSLAASLSVADNIFLGEELRRFGMLRKRRQSREALTILRTLESSIQPDTEVAALPRSSQQIVEIAKALRARANVLILDEPTAALTDVEARILGRRLRALKESATAPAIVYVTHRLREVFDVADRVTVLRDGSVVLSENVDSVSEEDLVRAIVGGAVRTIARRVRTAERSQPILELRSLRARGVGPIDLKVLPGEVLGVFGPLGSGRTELLDAIFGVSRVVGGSVRLDDRNVRFRSPANAVRHGVVLVPSERLVKSLFLPLGCLENLLMPSFSSMSRFGLRRFRNEREAFVRVGNRLLLKPVNGQLPSGQLSGGNQQKLVIGRWMRDTSTVKIFLLDEPTEGVDAGTRAELYQLLRSVVSGQRCAAIVTSSDGQELVTVADRAIVLSAGRIVAEVPGHEMTEAILYGHAHGARESAGT